MSISPGESHNSPAKDGLGEDIPFDEVTLYDRGDAPDTYGTTVSASGPSHQLILGTSVIRLGDTAGGTGNIDAEGDGQPTADATGDGADEDGIASFPEIGTLGPGDTYSVTVSVTNTTASSVRLDRLRHERRRGRRYV